MLAAVGARGLVTEHKQQSLEVRVGWKARRFDRLPFTFGRPPSTDIVGVRWHVVSAPEGNNLLSVLASLSVLQNFVRLFKAANRAFGIERSFQ